MAKFDAEDLLDAVLEVMTDNLNARISAIDAEKTAKGKELKPVLATIKASAYFRQSWSEKILNATPAIFYGIEECTPIDGGGVAATTYKIFCEVIYTDNGMYNDATNRILRYTRALKEIFEEAFKSVAEMSAIKIETVRPIAFKLNLDSSEEIKVGGVSLSITLA